METHKRSIVKTLSWRVIAVIITASVAWAITGKIRFALLIGGIDTAIKLVAYYVHERVWNKVRIGRVKDPDYQI